MTSRLAAPLRQSPTLGLSRTSVAHFRPARLAVRAAAGGPDGPKVVREFREDTGDVIVPGEERKADAALYADQLPPAMQKKENLSREMKQRLRQEYYGLGGAENKAMNSNYFLWIILAISVLAVLSKLTGAI